MVRRISKLPPFYVIDMCVCCRICLSLIEHTVVTGGWGWGKGGSIVGISNY